MQYSIAEVLDKLSILFIKVNITNDSTKIDNLNYQISKIVTELNLTDKTVIDITKDFENLLFTNLLIFQCVDFIQTSNNLDLVAIYAKKCQALNLERSLFKNKIDTYFLKDIRELEIKI